MKCHNASEVYGKTDCSINDWFVTREGIGRMIGERGPDIVALLWTTGSRHSVKRWINPSDVQRVYETPPRQFPEWFE